jgi:hypothetical protein
MEAQNAAAPTTPTTTESECLICDAELEHDTQTWTCPTCHHTICLECARRWFGSYLSYVIPDNEGDVPYVHTSDEHNTSCPYCRANVNTDGYADDGFFEHEEEEEPEHVEEEEPEPTEEEIAAQRAEDERYTLLTTLTLDSQGPPLIIPEMFQFGLMAKLGRFPGPSDNPRYLSLSHLWDMIMEVFHQ